MAASRLIILGVAAAAAASAGYVAKHMTATPPARIVSKAVERPSVPLSQVLVLTQDAPMGSTLGSQMRWQEWPKAALNPGFITRGKDPEAISKLKGSVVRVGMASGEPVRLENLIGHGQSFMSAILPRGMRAVATRISAETAAGGFILPNDRVDVIMTRRSQNSAVGNSAGYTTDTILKDVRVLAIDQTVQQVDDGKKTKLGATATLELTPEQAEIITVAQQMADRLTLVLRSVADDRDKPTYQADYLVAGAGRRSTVRLIKSGQVSEVGARQ